jgi:hypothetical protein
MCHLCLMPQGPSLLTWLLPCHPRAPVLSQAVARRVAYQTFDHVLGLDITFHMNRRTGRLSRILERGG